MSQKERIRAMFFREVELSAIEIHLIAGISLESANKCIWRLRMQGVITKTNKTFNARGRKYAVYRIKFAPFEIEFRDSLNKPIIELTSSDMRIIKSFNLLMNILIKEQSHYYSRSLYGCYEPQKYPKIYLEARGETKIRFRNLQG